MLRGTIAPEDKYLLTVYATPTQLGLKIYQPK